MGGEKKKNNEQQRQDRATATRKGKRKRLFPFGNYDGYYGYRKGDRLTAMKKEWFEGKDCLDIGCNRGLITVDIAQNFSCRSILGIDIDGARINDAYRTLRETVKSTRTVPAEGDKLAELKNVNCLKDHVAESVNKRAKNDTTTSHHLQEGDLSDIVSFEKGDFIRYWHPRGNTSYDTIICLSVTKWVQLNWGDEGLITLFSKVWRVLSPGGVFILEPQPWESYYKNRLVSETTRINYQEINIHPEDFQDILLDKIGFRMVEAIPSSDGFKRPMLAFWK